MSETLARAIEYHKTVEGEYGCPGESCPGVQRLVLLLNEHQSALAAEHAALKQRLHELLAKWDQRAVIWSVPDEDYSGGAANAECAKELRAALIGA